MVEEGKAMWRMVVGFLLGFLLAAALALGATVGDGPVPTALRIWDGEGRRPWLYYARFASARGGELTRFYECKYLGQGKVTPPGPQP